MSLDTSMAYLYQAPAGFPGTVTRPDESNVEPAMLVDLTGVYAQAFGIPVKYVAGGIQQFSGGEAATDFAGILVKEVPGISGNAVNQSFTDNVPYPSVPQGLLVRGYASVKCTQGTPARGGVVYVRVTASGGKNIGDFEAVSDTSLSVALTATQAEWASDGKDSDNNTEIRLAR
jgi:hypothetical protein